MTDELIKVRSGLNLILNL